MVSKGFSNNLAQFGKARKFEKVQSRNYYYLFLTFVLAVSLLQVLRGTYLNIAKYITLHKQFSKLESLNYLANKKNIYLKKQLKEYSSYRGIEALARDNMNMVGKDEVLVVIKK